MEVSIFPCIVARQICLANSPRETGEAELYGRGKYLPAALIMLALSPIKTRKPSREDVSPFNIFLLKREKWMVFSGEF